MLQFQLDTFQASGAHGSTLINKSEVTVTCRSYHHYFSTSNNHISVKPHSATTQSCVIEAWVLLVEPKIAKATVFHVIIGIVIIIDIGLLTTQKAQIIIVILTNKPIVPPKMCSSDTIDYKYDTHKQTNCTLVTFASSSILEDLYPSPRTDLSPRT